MRGTSGTDAGAAVERVAARTTSPNLNDQALLAADASFIGRVQESLAATCLAVINESETAAYHACPRLAVAVTTDASVIGDATVNGTTPLSGANVVAQGLLVTDVHINNTVSAQFNSFLNKAA